MSKSEQKRYDTYTKQLEDLKTQGQSAFDKLYGELAEADGTAEKKSEADRIQGEKDSIRKDLEATATYRKLRQDIQKAEKAFADKNYAGLDEEGFEKLGKKQKTVFHIRHDPD